MLPLHASGVAACTYHFFYNNPDLAFLVTLQAGLTALGNTTVAIAAFRLALSNGWTIGELDPRKLFSKGDDNEAVPATTAEAEAEAAAPAAAAYGGAAVVPSAAKLVLLTVLASFATKYGELALGGFPFLELGLPSEASLAIAAIMVTTPPPNPDPDPDPNPNPNPNPNPKPRPDSHQVITPPAAVAYRFNNL